MRSLLLLLIATLASADIQMCLDPGHFDVRMDEFNQVGVNDRMFKEEEYEEYMTMTGKPALRLKKEAREEIDALNMMQKYKKAPMNASLHGIGLEKVTHVSDYVKERVRAAPEMNTINAVPRAIIRPCHKTTAIKELEDPKPQHVVLRDGTVHTETVISTTSQCPKKEGAMHYDARICTICFQIPGSESLDLSIDEDIAIGVTKNIPLEWEIAGEVTKENRLHSDGVVKEVALHFTIQPVFNTDLYYTNLVSTVVSVLMQIFGKNKTSPAYAALIANMFTFYSTGEHMLMAEQVIDFSLSGRYVIYSTGLTFGISAAYAIANMFTGRRPHWE